MARVTALRSAGKGRVAVELDREPWRTLPLEPLLRAGVAVGRELDRPLARALRRELRRADALRRAGRALRARDLPVRELDARLARGGVAPRERDDAVRTLQRAGLVDDSRFAAGRAQGMAARGYGDAAIAWDLERRGVAPDDAAAALAALEPEAERARALIERRGSGAATARFLARKGFGDESVEVAAGADG